MPPMKKAKKKLPEQQSKWLIEAISGILKLGVVAYENIAWEELLNAYHRDCDSEATVQELQKTLETSLDAAKHFEATLENCHCKWDSVSCEIIDKNPGGSTGNARDLNELRKKLYPCFGELMAIANCKSNGRSHQSMAGREEAGGTSNANRFNRYSTRWKEVARHKRSKPSSVYHTPGPWPSTPNHSSQTMPSPDDPQPAVPYIPNLCFQPPIYLFASPYLPPGCPFNVSLLGSNEAANPFPPPGFKTSRSGGRNGSILM